MTTRSNKRKSSKPLAPPPVMRSRKRARKVTTLFHRYTRQLEDALASGRQDEVERLEKLIADMGGRHEYQRASQLSTKFHSTSKWVLGVLSQNGWLHGIVSEDSTTAACSRKRPRRTTQLLEIGAINTQLLDAAAETKVDKVTGKEVQKYRLNVRAIDLHSMDQRIEEADFHTMNLPGPETRYDCIVCSMVLNCVTTAEARGKMLCRIVDFLRPLGLAFLTLPKLCLTNSPFMTKERFQGLLGAIGLEVVNTKESPKLAFFICRRSTPIEPVPSELQTITIIPGRRGKKYRNDFSIALSENSIKSLVDESETKE